MCKYTHAQDKNKNTFISCWLLHPLSLNSDRLILILATICSMLNYIYYSTCTFILNIILSIYLYAKMIRYCILECFFFLLHEQLTVLYLVLLREVFARFAPVYNIYIYLSSRIIFSIFLLFLEAMS